MAEPEHRYRLFVSAPQRSYLTFFDTEVRSNSPGRTERLHVRQSEALGEFVAFEVSRNGHYELARHHHALQSTLMNDLFMEHGRRNRPHRYIELT